jgi:alpha-soluble NSF attachment protein
MKTQARHSLNNKLLKYGVKGHLLTAGMCHLCKADVVSITNALEKYQDLDPTFSGTRECKFLAVKFKLWCCKKLGSSLHKVC